MAALRGAQLATAWLLFTAAAGLRDNDKLSLELDDASRGCNEAVVKKFKALMRVLGYPGSLDGPHCELPGVLCTVECHVIELTCPSCHGRLPEHFDLEIPKVVLTSPNLTGDIKSFGHNSRISYLDLQGTQVSGDVKVLASLDHLQNLFLANTQVSGDIGAFNRSHYLESLDLSNNQAIGGSLRSLAGWLSTDGRTVAVPGLQKLQLQGTHVTGDVEMLAAFIGLRQVNLAHSQVYGRITRKWRGQLNWCRTLQLQNTSVQFVPNGEDLLELQQHRTSRGYLPMGPGHEGVRGARLLPELEDLDLSNCPVKSPLEHLMLPLAMSPLTSLKASYAGISGQVPDLSNVKATVEGQNFSNFTFPLAEHLLLLELNGNAIRGLVDLPVMPRRGRVFLAANSAVMDVQPGVLTKAVEQEIILDLMGTSTSSGTKEEAARLLTKGSVKATDLYAYRNESGGYACKDVVSAALQVTPDQFLPMDLCKCFVGWYGNGSACTTCAADSFSDEMGALSCRSCPQNSSAPVGSNKLSNCKCQFGTLHDGVCGCNKHQAFRDGTCILCSKVHLQCNGTGSLASTAAPEVEHSRLQADAEEARRCLPPVASLRCPGKHSCGVGYAGTLCASCADGYWAKGGRCEPCVAASSVALPLLLGGALVLAAAAVAAYLRRAPQEELQPQSAKSLLQTLLLRQAPVLLQTVQLWSVLSRLGQRRALRAGPNVLGQERELTEVSYLDLLRLTLNDLQSSLQLQCVFDAWTVNTLSALGSPLAPLLLLVLCAAPELYQPGLGVSLALKILTLLFIGGASSTAELLSCQSEDGDGEALGAFAFRSSLRHLRCSQRDGVALWVDAVGYGSAVAYGLVIPLCLAGLMVQQYFALQEARIFSAHAEADSAQVTLSLQTLLSNQLPTEARPKRLVAAASAYMAVHCRGPWRVQMSDSSVTCIDVSDGHVVSQDLDAMKALADEESSRNLDALRSRRLTEMLTERMMLEDTTDRLLIGSKPLLCKYTLCQDVWMDALMKLWAVALVSCCAAADGYSWAIAFSLTMAVLVGASRPYMQPQVSQLQSLSCFCLAVASIAFVYDCAWLARLALLAPVLLVLWQVLSPDCTEALAERLYQELQSQLPKLQQGEAHTVDVQLLRFR